MNDFNSGYNFNDFRMNMNYSNMLCEAQNREKKALLKNASILGILLVVYDILIRAMGYVFYFVFVSIRTSSITVSWAKVQEYFEANMWLDSSTTFAMAYSAFVVLASFAVILFTARFVFRIKLSHVYKFRRGQAKTAAVCFTPVMLTNLFLSLVIGIITLLLSQSGITVPEADFSISEPSAKAIFFQVLYGVIVAPIVEESLYRGLAIHLLKPYGKGMAVIVSSLIFGLMHGNVSQAASGFAFGLVMGSITVVSDSVVPTIAVHMMNNAVATIPEIADAYGSELIMNIYLAIAIACILVGLLIIFANHKKIRLPKDENCVLPTAKRYQYAMLNVPMIVYWCTIAYTFITSFIMAN